MTTAESPPDISAFMATLLPFAPEAFEAAVDRADESDLLSATFAAHAAAAEFALQQMDAAGRRTFCRQVASESEGAAAPWMVEAGLRSMEGIPDSLIGTDPSIMGSIPIWGLRVLSEKYLSTEQLLDLRVTAVERALAIQSAMRSLASGESFRR